MTALTTKREKKTSSSSNNTDVTYITDDDDTPTETSILNPGNQSTNSFTSSESSYSHERCANKIASFEKLKKWFIAACVVNVVLMLGIAAIFVVYLQEILKHVNKEPRPTQPTTSGPALQLPIDEVVDYESEINEFFNCSTGTGFYKPCYFSKLASKIKKVKQILYLKKYQTRDHGIRFIHPI